MEMTLTIYFLSTSRPDTSYQVSSQLDFLVQEKEFKIDFQDGGHGDNLGFSIGHIFVRHMCTVERIRNNLLRMRIIVRICNTFVTHSFV